MRATLSIDDELVVSANKLAAQSGTNASAVVSGVVRRFLEGREFGGERELFRMPANAGVRRVSGVQWVAIAVEHDCEWITGDFCFRRIGEYGVKLIIF